MTEGRTISIPDDIEEPRLDPEAQLVLVLNAARPLDVPFAIPFAGVDSVALGRGSARRIAKTSTRSLRVDLPDPAVSVHHATLERDGPEWVINDAQSKNGTLVNGKRIARATLWPEDLLELGGCFFVLRRCGGAPEAMPSALRTFDAALARELELFRRLSQSKVALLLLGETGTGKEVLARAAHDLSGRKGPFVAINCGAIPAALIESELFGVRKGAFTGALADRPGKVASAGGGTLFLDEIAELPEMAQAALLRVLQDGEVVPIGSTRVAHVDVRVVAATHQDLPARVAGGRFRDDLYARLRGHMLTLPPLRARLEDFGLLCNEILPRVAGERAAGLVIHRAAARAMLTYTWPHNIRELERVLARAAALTQDHEILLAHLPEELTWLVLKTGRATPRPDERTRLVELLRQHAGNFSAVARAMATSRSQLRRLLVRYGLDLAAYRGGGNADGG